MGLFDVVYRGSDEMYFKAEAAVKETIEKIGADAPVAFANTAFNLSCILAYTGLKVTTMAELRDALVPIRAMMTRGGHTADIFHSGVATAMAAEVIEACKYAVNPKPYGDADDPNENKYHGHMSDAEVRELGVPLVTRDIPGFVVLIDKAPTTEQAVQLIKGYQSRGIFVFLIGGIIDQAMEAGVKMGFKVRVVPVGPEIWSVSHIISVVVRAAFIFGNIQPNDYVNMNRYTMDRLFAFVNAFSPVNDITVACGAGAIALGFPVITNEVKDLSWRVPKSLIINENVDQWIDCSLEARGIKLKVTNMDIPIACSSAFEGEVIRRADTQIDAYGAKKDCFELVRTLDVHDIEDHKITVIGKDIDEFAYGEMISMATIVEVGGVKMQPDFEPVMERKMHAFINCLEGIMHTGQRDMIRIRVSKSAFEAGFRMKHFGELLYAKIKNEYDAVVDKCQVTIYTDPEQIKELRKEANKIYDARDARVAKLTDESVDVFYTCILCQSFSPSHVCIITPERLGLCGAVSWMDAKATNQLDPNGPCQIVTKERVIDESIGIWEDVNEAVKNYSHGALEQVSLYSILVDPMTSCGCFECICGIEPFSNGVVIVNREHGGVTPLGMSFSELAASTGGGEQTPGFMGHGRHFIPSKKFMKAEGGIARIVWMPKALKESVAERLNENAKELYGIDNFVDMIADETVAGDGDPETLMAYLTEKGHPVLGMEPLM